MFFIRIAELNIRIENRYENVKKLCKEYIIGDLPDEDTDLVAFATEADIDEEIAISDFSPTRGYAEAICIYRNLCKQLPSRFDAYLFHSALIEYEGKGYAFAAQSGTGKSTHIGIWQKVFGEKVRIVNGDKPIFRYSENNGFTAYGTPWCGKENLSINTSVKLCAICFLERGSANEIERITPTEALMRIFHQTLLPSDTEELDCLIPLLDKTLSEVPCYLLRCNMDDDAAIVAYNGMNK